MRSRALLTALLVVVSGWAQEWQIAAPGYQYSFPRDYFNHPAFQTEWWYYTGNLHAANGRKYGFELTFFRTGIHLPKQISEESAAVWRPDEIYLAHFALSDINGQHFYHSERINRAGPGLAGASIQDKTYWNGNWQVTWTSLASCKQALQAVAPEFKLQLDFQPAKPAVIQGQDGISRKGPNPSQASHYISFTRLRARGTLQPAEGTQIQLEGLAWMDHEFFSESRDSNVAGWDWFSIQLDDNQELMLYRLRQKSGAYDPYSSGTFIDAAGKSHFLSSTDFTLHPGQQWVSPHSKARYPIAWQIDVPSLALHLRQNTALADQELYSLSAITPSYWEGAVTYSGQLGGKPAQGVGYLEMTGYDKAVWLRQR